MKSIKDTLAGVCALLAITVVLAAAIWLITNAPNWGAKEYLACSIVVAVGAGYGIEFAERKRRRLKF